MKTVTLIVCILIACLAAISGATQYTVVDLGTLGGFSVPMDINDHGQVVGYSETGMIGTGWRAFIWSEGLMRDLGQIRSGNNIAWGINNQGQVVGTCAWSAGRAFLWDNGTITDLGALVNDPTAVSHAADINDLGQVVGFSNGISWWRPFFWEAGVMRDLGTPGEYGVAEAINNRGQVVGHAYVDEETHACLWQNGSFTDLGMFGGGSAFAIDVNENGEVLVHVNGPDTEHAFIWKDGQATDLNVLGARFNEPLDMNDACQVVGAGFAEGSVTPVGCLWDGEKMVDLAKHLPPEWNLMIQYGCAINNEGQIACTAMLPDFRVHAVLLTPEPGAISVTMEIKPNTLNPKSKGKYVTVYIELSAGRQIADIDTASLRLNGTIEPAACAPETGDYDADGIPDLMVKFDREALCGLLSAGEQTVTLTGTFNDGADLRGEDTIRVLAK